MKLTIDISKDRYDEIMAMDWRNCRRFFDEEIRSIHDGMPQRTGHWIMSDDGLYRPICNNCGAHPWKGYIPTVEEATKAFKYCPTCGIKMVEPQESEETCDTYQHNFENEHMSRVIKNLYDSLESEEISGEEIAALLARESEEQA